MPFYTVHKPGGTKDRDFEAYKGLLEESGLDLSRVPRVRDPESTNRWHYVWQDRASAEHFRGELANRTRQAGWELREVPLGGEDVGPLAPMDIVAEPTSEGTVLRLAPTSQERIMHQFPSARLEPEVLIKAATDQGPHGRSLVTSLTDLSLDQVVKLGGYRILEVCGTVLSEERS